MYPTKRLSLAGGAVCCALIGIGSAVWAAERAGKRDALARFSAAAPAAATITPTQPLKLDRDRVTRSAAEIDKLVLAKLAAAGQKPNAPATDNQFVRRIYLDAAGRIPTADETLAFVRDASPGKRAALIDRLLLSAGYRSQMFNWLADMLRVKDRIVPLGLKFYAYEEWLKDELAANRAWDKTVYAMLTAKGRLLDNGPSGYLIRDQYMPLDSLSNTLTVFLGANIACAQCHDHPLAGWSQRQFYELAAFFGGTATGMDNPRRAVLAKVRKMPGADAVDETYVKFVLFGNAADVQEIPGRTLVFPEDYKYDDAKPGDPVAAKFINWDDRRQTASFVVSEAIVPEKLRAAFAGWIMSPENPRFATAIANRLWRKAFGIGVQEPVTDLDDLSLASNPLLLAHLAGEMKRLGFDLREFQRVLYNTQAYQRQASSQAHAGPYLFPGPILRRMTPGQAWDSILALVAGERLDEYQLRRSALLREYALPPDQAVTPEAVLTKAKDLSDRKVPMVRSASSTPGDAAGAPAERIGSIRIARASELLQPEQESHFLRMFGQSSRDAADDSSLEGNIPQVLMLMNGDIARILGRADAFVMQQIVATKDSGQRIESLYRSFLSRPPTERERAAALKALDDGATMRDIAWALLNTREFIFVQ